MTEEYDWSRGFELMLDEGRRSIDSQRTAYEALRGRTGAVLAAAGAMAGVLISLTEHPSTLTWTGLVSLLAMTVLAMFVLRPRKVIFDMSPAVIRSYFHAGATGVNHMVDSVALAHWENYLSNEQALIRLHKAHMWLLILFVAESASLALDAMLH